ncbi:MAG: Holliday junction branch migration protein RuvA [Thermoanaerobaculia bacterium]
MIGFVKGKIVKLQSNICLVESGGVGYLCLISFQTYLKLKDKQEAFLWTYLQAKEECINLFGFFEEAEKDFFLKLISIPGIGPKMALQILSHLPLEDLKEAISNQDTRKLSSIPGIGKKTAERLILELKGGLPFEEKAAHSIREEAVSALVNLGYNNKMAQEAVEKVLSEKKDLPLEDLILFSLKVLGK